MTYKYSVECVKKHNNKHIYIFRTFKSYKEAWNLYAKVMSEESEKIERMTILKKDRTMLHIEISG